MQKKLIGMMSLGLMLGNAALAGGSGAPVTAPAAQPTTAKPALPGSCMSIADIVARDPQFSTLLVAVEAAGLTNTLKNGGPYTVFAPTNAAFDKLPSDQLSMVLNDPAMLQSLLMYHVVPGKVNAKQVMSLKQARTAQGSNVMVMTSGNKVMINDATVVKADVMACNGIVHVIDTVLMPQNMMGGMTDTTTTATTTTAAPVSSTPVVIPATPVSSTTTTTTTTSTATTDTTTSTDATATTDTSTDTTATTDTTTDATTDTSTDTTATTTETTGTTTATTGTTTTTTGTMTLDQVLADARFSTLKGLLDQAGLTQTLLDGEYTIFAPTNDAFAKLSADQVAALQANPDMLKDVLLYHVVDGAQDSAMLGELGVVTSLAGGDLNVMSEGGTLMVNDATIEGTGMMAGNSMVYVIDTVLMPDTANGDAASSDVSAEAPALMTLNEVLAADPRFSTLNELLGTSGLGTQLAAAGEYTIFAPTNDAFAKLTATQLSELRANPELLKRVLGYHIISGQYTVSDASSLTGEATLAGAPLQLRSEGGNYMLGTATVIDADLPATNGYIQAIDTVLMPPAQP
ncbi:fasciclin domain-containing protein [Deinococcus maricopensis]|uniref:Beta-Ig-H3/fasciclin n=1 Tax=Deinococcus maricopensis (strain DSM 21211 / LMG 22137 / NRRL B-23946 / LB-34) TaxID=709986 RepID=E8U7J3_DEIML|nr:fasciclin domain-containing protein [Deinococcus maricopensis]ADV67032.1 beta-Ig-H3/fasciclin [Deinococcus maricopensis DSM 21211]